jgi:glutathione S-transferase
MVKAAVAAKPVRNTRSFPGRPEPLFSRLWGLSHDREVIAASQRIRVTSARRYCYPGAQKQRRAESSTMTYRIHGTPGSPFVRKVRAAFGEKGVANELNPVDIFNPPAGFEQISPLKRIPVLEFLDQSGRHPLADSSAIVTWLEAAYPMPRLFPEDAYDRGRAVWFEEYADTVLAYQLGMGVMRPLLAARNGVAPDAVKLAEALEKRLPPLFGYLNSALGDSNWFAGNDYSIADLSVAAQLSGLVLVNRLDVLDPYPNLARLLTQARERPAFEAVIAEAMKPE